MEVWAVGDLPVKEEDEEGDGHVCQIKLNIILNK